MRNVASSTTKWRFWRWPWRRKKDSAQANSEPPEIARSARRSAFFERVELASAVLVVFSILAEDWDILPMAIYDPASKGGVKALAGVSVATFIALEILFSQLAKKHEGRVRGWQARRIAELNLEAEKEQHARSLIEQRLAWRRISREQRTAIANALLQFAGQNASIGFLIGDPEGAMLSLQLKEALNSAQWGVQFRTPTSFISFETGISINSTGGNKSVAAASALIRELRSIGLDVKEKPIHQTWPEPLVIVDISLNPASVAD